MCCLVCLTGTKMGCGEGGCGTCTVMVSKWDVAQDAVRHYTVNSCLTPVVLYHNCAITTVEGIGSTKTKLHQVQVRTFSLLLLLYELVTLLAPIICRKGQQGFTDRNVDSVLLVLSCPCTRFLEITLFPLQHKQMIICKEICADVLGIDLYQQVYNVQCSLHVHVTINLLKCLLGIRNLSTFSHSYSN